MGLTQLLCRFRRSLPNSTSLAILHNSPLPKFPIKAEHFIGCSSYRTGNQPEFWLSDSTRPSFRSDVAIPILRRSIHGSSTNAQISDEGEKENAQPPSTDQISKTAREICKLLSTKPRNTDIEAVLRSGGADFHVSPVLVLGVLRRLNNATGLALGFFRWAEKQQCFIHTTESCNALIDSLGRIRQFSVVWELVESMEDKKLLTKETFMIIVRRYAKAKMVSDAVWTFERMEAFGLKPDLSDFNSFLRALGYSGQIKAAQEVFDEMSDRRFVADQKTYAILLEGWGEQQDLPMVEAVFTEMKSQGFEPDAVTHGILVNAYCKAGQVDNAIQMFNNIKNPTPRMYCTLINALGSKRRLIEALKFFKMSRENLDAPEPHICNAVVRSYCAVFRFNEAYWITDEMRRLKIGPNSRTNDIILHHLVQARKIKEAYAFFKRIDEAETSTYEIVVRMFCNENRLDKAIRVWDGMKAKGVMPNVQMFSVLICGLCRERELPMACKHFEEMIEMGIVPPGQLFCFLRDHLLARGKKDVAFVLSQRLERMRKARLVSPCKGE